MRFNVNQATWIFEPKEYSISDESIVIKTEPKTDFWQRTYYGFQNDNAPALLINTNEQSFSFIVKTKFNSKQRFDQCGVIIYQDSDNWFKASIEYENESYQRLGSVVTNNGYSDWASMHAAPRIHLFWQPLQIWKSQNAHGRRMTVNNQIRSGNT